MRGLAFLLPATLLFGVPAAVGQQVPLAQRPIPGDGGTGSGEPAPDAGAGSESGPAAAAAAASLKKNPLLEDGFVQFVEEKLDKWHVPGVSVAVVDGVDTWAEGYGIATFPDTPATASTLYYAGSTTKAHTAAALALMIDSGNYSTDIPSPLSWTSTISSILRDDFVMQDIWATEHLTLEDALSHRTGMPRHDNSLAHWYDDDEGKGKVNSSRHPATVRDAVRSLRHLPATEEPRWRFQYCNLMFAVLSHVVETLAGGRWLGDLLREWLWLPLGLHSTYFSLEDALAAPEHLAGGYVWDDVREEFGRIPFMSLEEVSGAGSVITTVEDYARWIRFWINETEPLSKVGHAEIKTPRMLVESRGGRREGDPLDTPPTYALAWFTSSYRGNRFWTHAGGMDAYGAELFIFPDLDFGVVTLANTALTSNAIGQLIVFHLLDEKLGIPKKERFDWESKLEKQQKEIESEKDKAIDILYPDRADPPVPSSLPLGKYAGTYFNPGYQYLKLEVADPGVIIAGREIKLISDRRDFTWKTVSDFAHVSGENWIMYLSMADAHQGLALAGFAAVQFRIGADGNVSAVGIAWRSDNVDAGFIWYERVD